MGSKEEKIRKIIMMEDRIVKCKRCSSLLRCNRKPALGKGDLDPEMVLVFEMENEFTRDLNKLTGLRNLIKDKLAVNRIYHTFMVRCQPKACPLPNNNTWDGDIKLLDKEYNCILTGKPCEGVLVPPGTEDIISCLPFLVEEINILKPQTVVLFGEKVGDFVLKSFGIFKQVELYSRYQNEDYIFVVARKPEFFSEEEGSWLAKLA
ncbi:Uracil DNA glycosylase superfamily protein [Thermosyntropha lipolytica DSM 11003]|uniref:Uracil DNA glycosylase superfamily protein n=1 Tax=Thermosyntropha lipolytica DSM 11003 TaxID=1123382 RepID=A0A1M5QG37_9FIRM|nr:uracil-DNA glycosylase family protein [Thermosyntropha lipolytica]SHH12800.1 Uracil DNA glycosylase superfamily protein [Thermosyntropha lipolytica DSM 11003]